MDLPGYGKGVTRWRLLAEVLHPSVLRNVARCPQRRNTFPAKHVGTVTPAILGRPYRNEVIVPFADEFAALGARAPAFSRAWPNNFIGAFRCRSRVRLRHSLSVWHRLRLSSYRQRSLIPPNSVWLWVGRVETMPPYPAKAPRFTFL
jgi:hypothetical protein